MSAISKVPIFYIQGDLGRVGDWSGNPPKTTISTDEVQSFGFSLGFFKESKLSYELVYKKFGRQTLEGTIEQSSGDINVSVKRRVTLKGVAARAWNPNGWFSGRLGFGYYNVETEKKQYSSFPQLGSGAIEASKNPSALGYFFGFGLNIPVSRNFFHVFFDFNYYNFDDKDPPLDDDGNKLQSKSQGFGEATVGVRILL